MLPGWETRVDVLRPKLPRGYWHVLHNMALATKKAAILAAS